MKRIDPPAYVAMLQTARALGWPERFERDLTHHDRLWVSRLASGTPFLWAVHDSGTHAYTLDFRDGAGHTAADMARTIAETYPDALFYGWDGAALRTFSSVEVAQEWIRAAQDAKAKKAEES